MKIGFIYLYVLDPILYLLRRSTKSHPYTHDSSMYNNCFFNENYKRTKKKAIFLVQTSERRRKVREKWF